MRRALTAGLALLWAGCTAAPPAPMLPPGAEVVARFGDARALGLDALGTLYVADAAAATVAVLSSGRSLRPFLGGPGTSVGALVEPTDVDPTSGLAVFVSDAVSGTVVRYTDEARAVETVAVPDVDPQRAAPLPDAVLLAAEGRLPRGVPAAVAALPGGGLAVVDASRRVVLVLDARRRLERVLGGTAATRLAQPAGIAAAPDGTLWVADAGRDAVVLFSAVGARRGELAGLDLGGVRRVHRARSAMLVVGASGVAWVSAEGAVVQRRLLALGAPLVDAAEAADGSLYVLTRRHLLRLAPAVPGTAPDG